MLQTNSIRVRVPERKQTVRGEHETMHQKLRKRDQFYLVVIFHNLGLKCLE